MGWSAGVPNASNTDAYIIISGSAVTLDMSASVADLTVGGGNSLSFNPSTTLNVYGPNIYNSGQIAVTAGGYNNSFLQLQGSTTLSGGGTVTLGSDGTATAFILKGTSGLTLTNADNTIQGYGTIGNGGLTLANAGTINANSFGNTLTLNGSGGVTNTGTLEASNGGILLINGITVYDVGDSIQANGGAVQIQSSTIIGGALTASNGGTFNQGVNSTGVLLDGSTQARLPFPRARPGTPATIRRRACRARSSIKAPSP